MNKYLRAPGFRISLTGGAIFIVGVLLLFVLQILGAIVMIGGGLLVFAGLLMTLRTPTDVERRLEQGRR